MHWVAYHITNDCSSLLVVAQVTQNWVLFTFYHQTHAIQNQTECVKAYKNTPRIDTLYFIKLNLQLVVDVKGQPSQTPVLLPASEPCPLCPQNVV